VRSIDTLRRYVASSATADGGRPSVLSFAKTGASAGVFSAGRFFTSTPSGTVDSKTATRSW
jgi:hypothetical protein